jgi:hypothetical protein
MKMRATYQEDWPAPHLVWRAIKSEESSSSVGGIWAPVRLTGEGVMGTLTADTDATMAEERERVAINKERIIFTRLT